MMTHELRFRFHDGDVAGRFLRLLVAMQERSAGDNQLTIWAEALDPRTEPVDLEHWYESPAYRIAFDVETRWSEDRAWRLLDPNRSYGDLDALSDHIDALNQAMNECDWGSAEHEHLMALSADLYGYGAEWAESNRQDEQYEQAEYVVVSEGELAQEVVMAFQDWNLMMADLGREALQAGHVAFVHWLEDRKHVSRLQDLIDEAADLSTLFGRTLLAWLEGHLD